jgi:hypothetical protein
MDRSIKLSEDMAGRKVTVTVEIPYDTAVALRRATADTITAKDLRDAGLAVLEAVQDRTTVMASQTPRQHREPEAMEHGDGEQQFLNTRVGDKDFSIKVVHPYDRFEVKVNSRMTMMDVKQLVLCMQKIKLPPHLELEMLLHGKAFSLPDEKTLGDVCPDPLHTVRSM